jgi:O-antigen/teichoic acid export membrane protein
MHWAVVASIAGRVTTLVATLAALFAGLGFKTIVLATVIGNAVVFLVDLRVVWMLFPVRPTFDPVYWRRLVRTSLVLGSGIAILNIYFRIDAVLLALLRPAAEVGLYGAAYKFVELAGALSGGIVVSLVPSLTSLAARGDSRFNSLAQRGFDVLLFIAIPITVSMVLAAKTLLNLTAGPRFESASDALKILALYPLLSFMNAVFLRMLVAAHLERILLPIAVAILGLNVGLNLVFIPMYGYRAAAVASVASEAASLAAMGWMVRAKLGFHVRLPYIAQLFGAGGCMALVAWLLPAPVIASLVVGALVYLVILLLLPGTVRWTASELAVATRLRL